MPLKTLVKAGSITNLSDARYCAGMGVDLLGFRVVEGNDFILPKPYQEIRGWVTGPQIVAEVYGIKDVTTFGKIIEDYRPDYIELGLADLSIVAPALTLPFILYLREGEELPASIIAPAYILVPYDAVHLEKIIPGYDVLISVSSVDELEKALSKTGITGVALNGGKEIKPGLRDFDDIAQILEVLEVD